MQVHGAGISHVGCVRHRNEDAIYIDGEGRFCLLADGMGGHRGGQEASAMAIRVVCADMENLHPKIGEWAESEFLIHLKEVYQSVSRQVFEAGLRDPQLAQMGTTLVSWMHKDGRVVLAHVGDSRAYLCRDGNLFQLTMDHTIVNEQVNLLMPRTQVSDVGFRNAIFRNIGMSPPSDPAVAFLQTLARDIWLLCSDGLSAKLTANQIKDVLSLVKCKEDLQGACQKLVEGACAAGGEDNVSVVVLLME